METDSDPFSDSSRAVNRLDENIDRIIELNTKIANFWSVAHGWAPKSAADLLSNAALDWQVDLSKSLRMWASDDIRRNHADSGDALLILAWANLGSLTEATMMWFVSVFHEDYLRDPTAPRKKDAQTPKPPPKATFDDLRQFFDRVIWPEKEFAAHRHAVAKIQQRRNAIHSFSRRELGDWEEWCDCVAGYLDTLFFLDALVPYPD